MKRHNKEIIDLTRDNDMHLVKQLYTQAHHASQHKDNDQVQSVLELINMPRRSNLVLNPPIVAVAIVTESIILTVPASPEPMSDNLVENEEQEQTDFKDEVQPLPVEVKHDSSEADEDTDDDMDRFYMEEGSGAEDDVQPDEAEEGEDDEGDVGITLEERDAGFDQSEARKQAAWDEIERKYSTPEAKAEAEAEEAAYVAKLAHKKNKKKKSNA